MEKLCHAQDNSYCGDTYICMYILAQNLLQYKKKPISGAPYLKDGNVNPPFYMIFELRKVFPDFYKILQLFLNTLLCL